MNINRTRRPKKTVTLSIVRSITTNWYRRAGMKRTSLRIRSRRKVRRTERPPLPSWKSSRTLKRRACNWIWRERLPQGYNSSIEEVEPIGEITKKPVGNDLEKHFKGKESCEEKIRIFQQGCKKFRLKVTMFTISINWPTCWWYSTPMDKVFTRIATRIPLVKWSQTTNCRIFPLNQLTFTSFFFFLF